MVYGLHAADSVVMYVGQTRCTLAFRLQWHLKNAATKNARVFVWMRERMALGEEIGIIMIEPNGVWDISEVIWIDRLRQKGVALTNMTAGGRSSPGT